MSLVSWIKNKITPKPATAPSLAGWKAEWDYELRGTISAHLDKLSSAYDVTVLCSDYHALPKERKIQVWVELFKALAYYESGFNPNAQSVDVGVKNDKDTWSIGLLQVSVCDQKNYKYLLGYDFVDLLRPTANLKLGVCIMVHQVEKKGKIFIPWGWFGNTNGAYWATLSPGNRYDKSAQIIAAVKRMTKEWGV